MLHLSGAQILSALMRRNFSIHRCNRYPSTQYNPIIDLLLCESHPGLQGVQWCPLSSNQSNIVAVAGCYALCLVEMGRDIGMVVSLLTC